jgi:glycosyltransferase involved in cell wall biosynthesis
MDYRETQERPKYMYPLESFFSKRKVIGVIDPCYGSSHVIYPLELEFFKHKRVLKLPLNALDKRSTFHEFTPLPVKISPNLLHTWNSLPRYGDFIVSFELEIPRFLGNPSDYEIEKGLKMLASKRCKAIAALSEFAASNARAFFKEKGYEELNEKICVLRGTVPDPRQKYNLVPKTSDKNVIKAVVIGTQLFRKGGMYAIKAFEKLRQDGVDVELTLIGKFEDSSYVFGDFIPDAIEWTKKAHSYDWVKMLPPVSNKEVFEQLAEHDLCLYPSIDESLGWLPIEASMLGVPVVACNIGAFNEFVDHNKTGFLIDIPLSKNRRWVGLNSSGKDKKDYCELLDKLVVEGIFNYVKFLAENKAKVLEMGNNARRFIEPMYGAKTHAASLDNLYSTVFR